MALRWILNGDDFICDLKDWEKFFLSKFPFYLFSLQNTSSIRLCILLYLYDVLAVLNGLFL